MRMSSGKKKFVKGRLQCRLLPNSIRVKVFAAGRMDEDGEADKGQEMREMSPSEPALKRSGSRSDTFSGDGGTVTYAVKDTAKVTSRHQRLRKRRIGILAAGLSALVIAGGMFMWSWDDGRLAKPLVAQINPASALLFADHLNVDILTNQMKKNVAITMRDDLGKQPRITKVQRSIRVWQNIH